MIVENLIKLEDGPAKAIVYFQGMLNPELLSYK